jgi:hypothetical protein
VHSQLCRPERDERGEDRAVCPVKPGPRTGPARHGDLAPEHAQLGVISDARTREPTAPR